MSSEQMERELLELAAKAAGIAGTYQRVHQTYGDQWVDGIQTAGNPIFWNPLADDGDALRLAVKLRIQVTPGTYDKDEFTALNPSPYGKYVEHWHSQQDELAATRRAIVRAAAQLAAAPSAPQGVDRG